MKKKITIYFCVDYMKKKKTLIAGVQLNIHYTASVSMNHESLLTNLFDLI